MDVGAIVGGSILDIPQQIELIKPFSAQEIKQAFFSIGSHKSLGVDGYCSDFFKKSWGMIGDSVCKAVWDFFDTGTLSPHLKHTLSIIA